MKKYFSIILIIIALCPPLYSQRIIFQSDFENITLNSDSLPIHWARFDVDHNNPSIKWAVRDTSVSFGGPTRPQAHNSAKSLEIPWYAGNGGNDINDDWVFTDSFTVQQGDSLIFWMLIGSDTNFVAYIDSMQVWVAALQEPGGAAEKLATIISNRDSLGHALNNNVWTIHKFSLNSVIGYQIFLGFRYYMNISVDGLWCNIDDMFIGNHSAIGIKKISSNIPVTFNLYQNYPNPFNPTTTFQFDLPRKEFVNIVLYNTLGQQLKTLLNEQKDAGSYKVDFNGSDLASGTYFYKITAGDFVKTNKMVLVK